MSIYPTLSAPLPWLIAAARLLIKKKQPAKERSWSFALPRTLSFTKEGKRFIAILFVIGIAAINTGNNLLYLVVAMMLSIIVISGILSESTLRDIAIRRTKPEHLFAGRPATVKWNISNIKKVVPTFSIVIDELHDNKEFSSESGYLIKLPARASVEQTHSYTFNKRGLYKLTGFKIRTRFPFGFFLKGRKLLTETDLLVYPNLKPISWTTASNFLKDGESPEKTKGSGVNLHSIRDYNLTDDSRFIHWKSTAKTAKLMAKEFEREGGNRVKILFYNTLFDLSEHSLDKKRDLMPQFENKVEDAAGMAYYFLKNGFEVGFKTLDIELPCKSGKFQLYRILRELAIIKPVMDNKTSPMAVKVVRL